MLATPTAIIAGIGNATKYGILIRQGDALERLSKISNIVFDKTGTLTIGKPVVVAIESFSDEISPEKLLELTASSELRSEHPLGKAIVTHFRNTSNANLQEPQKFTMISGRGVKATVSNNDILAGTVELFL